MTTPSREYSIRRGEPKSDRETVLSIWRGQLGYESRLEAKYDWFYLGCPWGVPLVQLLRHEPSSSWVGVAAVGARRMVQRGRSFRAGVIADFAVAKEHRSLGPAISLQKALLAGAAECFELLYGFPNAKAGPVMKRVGYRKIGEMVRYARVLRHARYLRRRLPPVLADVAGAIVDFVPRLTRVRARRLRAAFRAAADPRMDDLWARSDQGAGPIMVRDAASVRWRFDGAVGPPTRHLLVSDADDRLHAWFACQADDQGTLHVRDFWSAEAVRAIDRSFVEALLDAAYRTGHVSVSVELGGAASKMAGFLEAGFVERGRRPVYARWSEGSADLHLTAADEDE